MVVAVGLSELLAAELGKAAKKAAQPAKAQLSKNEPPPVLEPSDVKALEAGIKQLRVKPGLLQDAEYAFFKDFLHSVGASLPKKITIEEELEADDKVLGEQEEVVCDIESDHEERKASAKQRPMAVPSDEIEDELESEDEKGIDVLDAERLVKETEPFPPLPPRSALTEAKSAAHKKLIVKLKSQATEALEFGDAPKALEKYNDALVRGDATAMTLATRASLLLRLKRPSAAIRDCCAAMRINEACGKAYHVRGAAHRALAHWKKANRDLTHAQKIEYNEGSVAMHQFVITKSGIPKHRAPPIVSLEQKRRQAEMLFDVTSMPTPREPVRDDLKPGQAVYIYGLVKANHLNGKRGVILRVDEAAGRFEVELRLGQGKQEVKALKGENIVLVKSDQADRWKSDEASHAENKKKRDAEDKRWKEQEDKRKRADAEKRAEERKLRGEFPIDMEPSEMLEAEMSALPLNEKALGLLRRLKPQQSLGILQNVGMAAVGNLSIFVTQKIREILGEQSDEEEAPVEEAPIDDGKDDPERMPEEKVPLPQLPPEARLKMEPLDNERLRKAKRAAADALEGGDVETAIEKYSFMIAHGGATALVLTKRAELMLRQRRPRACIKDCTAALSVNADCGKAFRVRGVASRKLGLFREAHRDLAEGQRLDYDEGTASVQKFVIEKVRLLDERKKPPAKRARTS